MNVVIYARFSSHSQTEQSIEGQLKVCYEYAESNHYTVVGEYIDRAISGTTDNRAEFQRMMPRSLSSGRYILWRISCHFSVSSAVTASFAILSAETFLRLSSV